MFLILKTKYWYKSFRNWKSLHLLVGDISYIRMFDCLSLTILVVAQYEPTQYYHQPQSTISCGLTMYNTLLWHGVQPRFLLWMESVPYIDSIILDVLIKDSTAPCSNIQQLVA